LDLVFHLFDLSSQSRIFSNLSIEIALQLLQVFGCLIDLFLSFGESYLNLLFLVYQLFFIVLQVLDSCSQLFNFPL